MVVQYGNNEAAASRLMTMMIKAVRHDWRRTQTAPAPAQIAPTRIAFWKSVWTLKIASSPNQPARNHEGFFRNIQAAVAISATRRLPRP